MKGSQQHKDPPDNKLVALESLFEKRESFFCRPFSTLFSAFFGGFYANFPGCWRYLLHLEAKQEKV
jgi:hypothetical protein